MAFNRKKFMDAIVAMAATQVAPAPFQRSDVSFAQFMAGHSFGMSDSTDASILAKQTEDRKPGALSNVFSWLTAPMRAVESSLLDLSSDQSAGEKFKNIGLDIAGGVASLAQPQFELAAIPGVKAPWENLATPPS